MYVSINSKQYRHFLTFILSSLIDAVPLKIRYNLKYYQQDEALIHNAHVETRYLSETYG